MDRTYSVIVIGGGHAGLEAAWAAANLLGGQGRVALISISKSKIGTMSCNPAIGGLAKGQLVREIDAMGGFMGLVADATGIQFKVLNTSKGSAVHGQRCQSDKHAYARVAQRIIGSRDEIDIIEGTVEDVLIDLAGQSPRAAGVRVETPEGEQTLRRGDGEPVSVHVHVLDVWGNPDAALLAWFGGGEYVTGEVSDPETLLYEMDLLFRSKAAELICEPR